MIRHIVWDWNGTLMEDAPLSHAITDEMLRARGKPGISLESYRATMGHPYEEAYRRAGFDYGVDRYRDLAAFWAAEYAARWKHYPLRPGARETLESFARLGLTQSILTASREDLARDQIAHFGLDPFFCRIDGVRDDLAAGKDHLAQSHLKALGLQANDLLVIGDSKHDAETAKAIGCPVLLVEGGHMDSARLRQTREPVLPDLWAVMGEVEKRL